MGSIFGEFCGSGDESFLSPVEGRAHPEPSRVQDFHGNFETLADFADDIFSWNYDVIEIDVGGVRALLRFSLRSIFRGKLNPGLQNLL